MNIIKIPEGVFFGDESKSIVDEDYLLKETHHSSKSVIPYHTHTAPYFSLVLSGKFAEKSRLNAYPRKAGTLVYHPSGFGHCDNFSNGNSRIFNIQLSGSLQEKVNHLIWQNEFKLIFNEKTISQARRIHNLFLGMRENNSIHDEIFRLIEFVNDCKGIQLFLNCPNWFKMILEYIDLYYSESILLDTLSSLVNKHPVHISRMFGEYLDCSMKDYVHKVRIEQACTRLQSKNTSISYLAYELGYSDHSHFTHYFTRFVGLPPSVYRQLYIS